MEFIKIKLLAALAIFVLTLIAAIIPFRKRFNSHVAHDFPIGEALAAGVFLGAGLIHLLGETAFTMAAPHTDDGHHHGAAHPYPWPFVICGVSFLFLLFLEHVGNEVRHRKLHNQNIITLLTITILSLHSLFAGAALGIVQNVSSILILSFAILAHKWAESFALAVQINKSSLQAPARIGYFVLFMFMTPIGILIGENIPILTDQSQQFEMIFTSLAAGTFLYIGTLHGLTNAPMIKRCCNLKEFLYVVLGFGLMAVVGIWT